MFALACRADVLRANLSDHKLHSDSCKVTPAQDPLTRQLDKMTHKRHCGQAGGAPCYQCHSSAGSHEHNKCYFRQKGTSMSSLRAALPVLLATRSDSAHTCTVCGHRRRCSTTGAHKQHFQRYIFEISRTCVQLCAALTAFLLLQLELFFPSNRTARSYLTLVYCILFFAPSIRTSHYYIQREMRALGRWWWWGGANGEERL